MNSNPRCPAPRSLSTAATLGLLLLMSACSTITPPAVPEAPPAPPTPIVDADDAQSEIDRGAQPRPPVRPAVRPPAKRPPIASRQNTAPSREASTDGRATDPNNLGNLVDNADVEDGDDDRKPLAGPQPKLEPLASQANRPYRLRGRQYQPMTELKPYRQRGLASWYGKPFHGRKTAIGERYDMNTMTAAHPTLPLPSYVKVRNLKNGNIVIVRVNDRGPFADGRIIDLSLAAARHLGFVEGGIAAVEIDLIMPEPAGTPLPSAVADSRN